MGCGGTGGEALAGLLPLDTKDPDVQQVFRSGDIHDQYEVEKDPIARGKFASVRLARHRITKEIFAAKFVRRRRRAASLEQEARHEICVLLLGRGTPYIAQLHQVYETRSEYIIILEFGEGGDLQRILDDEGRLQEKTVRDLLRQILRGLKFLHQKFIAHLDIKPQNLVLMGSSLDDGVKLVDFGLSRVIHRNAELTQIMGTPDYVAPEVINFEPVGLATDMWSIGVLTYVLLTGYTPFGGNTDQETFVNITHAEFDFLDEYFDGVSDRAKEFISGLLLKSPNQRMSVDQCLAHPWLSDLLDPHRLSQLSEAESADSGYSTDLCSSSPPSPGTVPPHSFVADLCHFSIPEDQQLSTRDPSLCDYESRYNPHPLKQLGEDEVDRGGSSIERRPKISSAHLSINVLDCLRGDHYQPQHSFKQVRGSSLILLRFPTHSSSSENYGFGNDVICDFDSNQTSNSTLPLNYYDSDVSDISDSTLNLNSCTKTQDLRMKKCERNVFHNNPLESNQSWTDVCHGSYNKATMIQLKAPVKKTKPKTNLGMRPELSYSMFELNPNYESQRSTQSSSKSPRLRSPKKDSRMHCSKKEGRNPLKNDSWGQMLSPKLRSQTPTKEASSGLRTPKCDSRDTRNYNLRNCQSEIRAPNRGVNTRNKDKNSNSPLVRTHLFSSHNFASIPCLNMSLSHLDIAHESLEENEKSEERDTFYGDCTLPRRFSRSNNSNYSNMLGTNSFHMSFRRPKKRDNKI